VRRESSYEEYAARTVDAIVSTIGFPLVGGPAGDRVRVRVRVKSVHSI
jgi:hypothetical protein